jgi:DNA end-binding protein Ku
LALANTLIEALASKFEPEKYRDTYRDNLMAMIETKIQGQKVVEAPEPHVAPVIDIMEALKRTLEIRKKPVQAESEASTGAEEAAPVEAVSKKRRAAGKRG